VICFSLNVSVFLCEGSEVVQVLIFDVGLAFFREQELVNLIPTALRENDASVHVLVQALLEYPATKIVRVALPYFLDSFAKFVVVDASLACRLGEPGGFEGPREFLGIGQGIYVALGTTGIKCGTTGASRRHGAA
jgi:hypothetical protein